MTQACPEGYPSVVVLGQLHGGQDNLIPAIDPTTCSPGYLIQYRCRFLQDSLEISGELHGVGYLAPLFGGVPGPTPEHVVGPLGSSHVDLLGEVDETSAYVPAQNAVVHHTTGCQS